MKVALLQSDITWASPKQNCSHIAQLLGVAEHSDLYVFPEMFPTGFVSHPEGIAEELRGGNCYSLLWMKQMSVSLDAALCGSIAVREADGRYYNRLYFITPDGRCEFYDKHHLFAYGGEHLCYTPGEGRVVVKWRGVRLLLQVCYDLRFPVFSRWCSADPYDAIIYVANWPCSRQDVWQTLLRARAIENQCYVLGVNRVGTDPSCNYAGGSMLISPYGNIQEQCPMSEESVIVADMDMVLLEDFRKKFPVLDDADS